MKRKRRPHHVASVQREPSIENHQKALRVPMRALLQFADQMRKELGLGEGSIAVRLVTDAEMARLNQMYRNKKGTTDVLSFPAEERRIVTADDVRNATPTL